MLLLRVLPGLRVILNEFSELVQQGKGSLQPKGPWELPLQVGPGALETGEQAALPTQGLPRTVNECGGIQSEVAKNPAGFKDSSCQPTYSNFGSPWGST